MAGMRVNTKSDKTRIARGGVMEFLLANHPLDCPICDQGGECDLQDISEQFGYGESRFYEYKRGVEDKEIGPLVKTTMTRCIHCTRCIRFSEEVAGSFALGTTGRGRSTEVGTYVENLATSELSSNIVDLCPVGALTNKPYAFKARPWELKTVPSVDILDTILPNIGVDSRGVEIMRVLPRINDDVNEEWIGDKSRHALDGNKRQRLTVPMLKDEKGVHVDKSWDRAIEEVVKSFNSVKSDEIQVLIGEHTDLETMCSIRDLMNRLDVDNVSLGNNSINVDSSVRSGYLMNSRIRGIEDSDLLLLVGINPRYESPVLNARIRKAVSKSGLKVGLLGSPYDLTYEYTHIGTTTKALVELMEGTHPFCSKIARAKLPMILVGSSILGKNEGIEMYNALIKLSNFGNFIKPKENWNGFNILHNHISTIGASELGIKPFKGNNKNSKLVILLGYDSIEKGDIPDDAKVIYIGSHGDKGAERADIILPGATFYEKNSTYVSTEGRVETTRP
ncbi:MAG: NADH-quinone oxidoreductase subunit NuoG, partial [bacterium]